MPQRYSWPAGIAWIWSCRVTAVSFSKRKNLILLLTGKLFSSYASLGTAKFSCCWLFRARWVWQSPRKRAFMSEASTDGSTGSYRATNALSCAFACFWGIDRFLGTSLWGRASSLRTRLFTGRTTCSIAVTSVDRLSICLRRFPEN